MIPIKKTLGISRRVPLGRFLGPICGGSLTGLLLECVGAVTYVYASNDTARLTALIAILIGELSIAYAEVVFLVLLHKAWSSIQDGSTSITPGKAVGFLFIPIFNWFWAFRALPGFAAAYNAYLAHANSDAPCLNPKSLRRLAICQILSTIPILGTAARVRLIWIRCVVAKELCGAINALPQPISGS